VVELVFLEIEYYDIRFVRQSQANGQTRMLLLKRWLQMSKDG
jgi:hypothetical protein